MTLKSLRKRCDMIVEYSPVHYALCVCCAHWHCVSVVCAHCAHVCMRCVRMRCGVCVMHVVIVPCAHALYVCFVRMRCTFACTLYVYAMHVCVGLQCTITCVLHVFSVCVHMYCLCTQRCACVYTYTVRRRRVAGAYAQHRVRVTLHCKSCFYVRRMSTYVKWK